VTTLGQTIWRARVEVGCELMGWVLFARAISLKRPSLSSAKGPKKPHRVI
jgi:hypothetical protein